MIDPVKALAAVLMGSDADELEQAERECQRDDLRGATAALLTMQPGRYIPARGPEPDAAKEQKKKGSETYRSIAEIPGLDTFSNKSIDFVVDGILASGTITAITGDSGAGKTSVVAAMCSAISHGEMFAGRKTQKREVLILDRENPLSVVVERYNRLGIKDHAGFKHWGGWFPIEAPSPGSGALLTLVNGCEPKPVVVFDSFIRFHEGSENDSADIRKTVAGLRLLADLGAIVVVLHHSGKAETSKEYRGSSDFKAGIDCGFVCTNMSSDPSRLGAVRWKVFKARFLIESSILLQYRDGKFEADERGPVPTISELLQQLLTENAGISASEFEAKAAN